MAYVAITDTLVGDVTDFMRNLQNAELRSLYPEGATDDTPAFTALADPAVKNAVYDMLWADVLDLQPRLAKYNSKGYIRFEFNVVRPDNLPAYRANQTVEWTMPCIYTNKFKSSYDPLIIGEKTLREIGVFDMPAFVAWREYETTKQECNVRWSKLTEQVKAFLRAAKSLNEAVKLWPDLRRYLPDSAKERLDKKNERVKPEASAAAQALAAIDTAALQASTVIARMAGAKV